MDQSTSLVAGSTVASSGSPQPEGQGRHAFQLPETCACSIQYPPGDSSFEWTYDVSCPVALRDHPMYRFEFGIAQSMGSSFAGVGGYGTIFFGDKGVCSPDRVGLLLVSRVHDAVFR